MKKPNKAFVLAAGRGVRMRPLTDLCPKPLLPIAGRTMIDRALDSLLDVGVQDVVVNLNYLGHMIEDHLKKRTDINIEFSWENELLETGGGVKKCLDKFGDEPFFVLNSDVVWVDGAQDSALKRLHNTWHNDNMDMLLLLQDVKTIEDYKGEGDYSLSKCGRIKRRLEEEENVPYIFSGPRIVHPRIFENSSEGAFSFLELFDKAQKTERLHGLAHDDMWYHVGTPMALSYTERKLSKAEEITQSKCKTACE